MAARGTFESGLRETFAARQNRYIVFGQAVEPRGAAVQNTACADRSHYGAYPVQQPNITRHVTARLAETLRSSVNGDGGWGYFPGKASRIEPTSWAILALLDSGATTADGGSLNAALARIAGWQRADGLLADVPAAPPNLAFSGLAAIVIYRALAMHRADARRHGQVADALLSGILATKGSRFARAKQARQNNQLMGWPWNDGAFSWVEPTSWCLLALKKTAARPPRAGAAERIAEAERMLADRCCLSGGWNYGNSNVLGKELFPYVSTTAVALLALQNRRELPEVARSLAWLAGNWTREVSAMASSLALMAMRLYGRPVDDLERALCDRIVKAGPPGNLASTALVLYAVTGSRHEYAALAL